MHGKTLNYLVVAGLAALAGLLIGGTSVQSLLSFALLLGCPLMMIFMMRGMGGHGGDHDHHDHPGVDGSRSSDRSAPGQDR